jgi:hypothetical protein
LQCNATYAGSVIFRKTIVAVAAATTAAHTELNEEEVLFGDPVRPRPQHDTPTAPATASTTSSFGRRIPRLVPQPMRTASTSGPSRSNRAVRCRAGAPEPDPWPGRLRRPRWAGILKWGCRPTAMSSQAIRRRPPTKRARPRCPLSNRSLGPEGRSIGPRWRFRQKVLRKRRTRRARSERKPHPGSSPSDRSSLAAMAVRAGLEAVDRLAL